GRSAFSECVGRRKGSEILHFVSCTVHLSASAPPYLLPPQQPPEQASLLRQRGGELVAVVLPLLDLHAHHGLQRLGFLLRILLEVTGTVLKKHGEKEGRAEENGGPKKCADKTHKGECSLLMQSSCRGNGQLSEAVGWGRD